MKIGAPPINRFMKIKCDLCDKEYSFKGIGTHVWRMHGTGKNHDPNFGRVAWNKGLTKSDPRVLKNGQNIGKAQLGKPGKPHTEATKQKISEALSGNNHGGRCSWFLVDGIYVQGTWERDFAIKLNDLGIKWEKVKKHAWKYQMHGRVRHYTPDFYLPEHDTFIELKGYWWGNDKEKMKFVLDQHSDKKLKIIQREEYEKFLMCGELVWS